MKNLFKFVLPIALIPVFATGCGGDGSHYVTFHQELAEDVKIKFNKDTTDAEIIAQEPAIVAKEGFDAKWEDYTIVGKTKNFTVNAIYSEYTFTVTFKQKGLVIDTVPFTASDVKGEHPQLPAEKVPACPSDTWFTYKWEDYELKLGNVVVNAVCTGEIEHIAKFTDGDKVIAEGFKFGRYDVDNNGCLKEELIPEKVLKYVHDTEHPTYWDNNWNNFKVPAGSDINVTFDANVTKHNFELKFVDFKGGQVGDIAYYQFDTDWASIPKPEAPTKTGYTVTWPSSVTYTFTTEVPMEVAPSSTANTYTITFEGYEDSQTVTFDSDYTLNHSEDIKDGIHSWSYSDGDKMIPIPLSGKWKIDHDIFLKKEVITYLNFEDGIIPKFITTASGNTMSILDNGGVAGSKCLKIAIGSAGDTTVFNLSKDYLEAVFAKSDIESITFDAKADTKASNFRSHYVAFKTDDSQNEGNYTYETNDDKYGVAADRWKTFVFKREYFENNKDVVKFLYGTLGSGNNVYIDNITAHKDIPESYGFEGGYLDSTTNRYYSGGHSDNRFKDFVASQNIFYLFGEDSALKANLSVNQDIHSEGNTSLKFTKASGSIPLYLSNYQSIKNDFDYMTFDLYTTNAYNGNSTRYSNFTAIEGFGPSDVHAANQWYTFKIDNDEREGSEDTDYRFTNDGRFFYLIGSFAADIYIDNIQFFKNV